MKKRILLAIVSMATLSISNAHTVHPMEVSVEKTDEYQKIDASELPPAVVEALLKDYPTSKLSQAFKNRYGKYKLIMVLQSGTRRTVYIDSYGRWLPKK
ncbi:hypothetical protein L0P88_12315 [Muricauda sp. SCSIO 64092]|uniref:hypothetical protein n=1 Tax=Allomuricauda sp. SCSIO 64092 TaxID=2908842 RepID=UPI001FF44EFE|nr:hypothetical protein [Muricauda sp. SCSIO 64092]UOY04741.1 hypothetical protein L0P88_12315 [Muricauda sp. SCSIO 64092]